MGKAGKYICLRMDFSCFYPLYCFSHCCYYHYLKIIYLKVIVLKFCFNIALPLPKETHLGILLSIVQESETKVCMFILENLNKIIFFTLWHRNAMFVCAFYKQTIPWTAFHYGQICLKHIHMQVAAVYNDTFLAAPPATDTEHSFVVTFLTSLLKFQCNHPKPQLWHKQCCLKRVIFLTYMFFVIVISEINIRFHKPENY